MGLTTTPNALRYPVRADTPDPPRDIQRLAEDTELALANYAGLPFFGKPYIKSGATIGNPGGLFASITAGIAMINGWRFSFAAPANLALAASTTNHIWLKQTKDGNGRHIGHTWVVKQTQAVEADGVYVGQVITGASVQSSRNDSFRGIIATGTVNAKNVMTTNPLSPVALGAGAWSAALLPLPVMGDGVSKQNLEVYLPRASTNQSHPVDLAIFDGAINGSTSGATGIVIRQTSTIDPAGAYDAFRMDVEIDPFVGLKTFNVAIAGSLASTFAVEGSVQWINKHRAIWMPQS